MATSSQSEKCRQQLGDRIARPFINTLGGSNIIAYYSHPSPNPLKGATGAFFALNGCYRWHCSWQHE